MSARYWRAPRHTAGVRTQRRRECRWRSGTEHIAAPIERQDRCTDPVVPGEIPVAESLAIAASPELHVRFEQTLERDAGTSLTIGHAGKLVQRGRGAVPQHRGAGGFQPRLWHEPA